MVAGRRREIRPARLHKLVARLGAGAEPQHKLLADASALRAAAAVAAAVESSASQRAAASPAAGAAGAGPRALGQLEEVGVERGPITLVQMRRLFLPGREEDADVRFLSGGPARL